MPRVQWMTFRSVSVDETSGAIQTQQLSSPEQLELVLREGSAATLQSGERACRP